jgi:LPXTG-motif cell wall-anchored protein
MTQRSLHKGFTAIGLGSMLAGAVVLVGAFPGDAGAAPDQTASTTSTSVVSGNPTCADLGDFDFEFKIDAQPEEGVTYEDPNSDFEVTITDVVAGNPMTFSFESNIPVSAVLVKAGPGGILYTFDPPSTVGTDLASPKDSISHVSFCWNEEQATTTTESTTTTTQASTSTTESTTTTTQGTTTTTVAGSTTTLGGTSTTAAGVVTTAPSPGGGLPTTGSNTTPLLALAAGLLIGGAALVGFTRRLRNS